MSSSGFSNRGRQTLVQAPVQAYAKLQFEESVYYIQTLSIVLGRRSPDKSHDDVDVDLGPSKIISRRHARIAYNFATRQFEISSKGKNGVIVDGQVYPANSLPIALPSKAAIQIGDVCFFFLLPVGVTSCTVKPLKKQLRISIPNRSDTSSPLPASHADVFGEAQVKTIVPAIGGVDNDKGSSSVLMSGSSSQRHSISSYVGEQLEEKGNKKSRGKGSSSSTIRSSSKDLVFHQHQVAGIDSSNVSGVRLEKTISPCTLSPANSVPGSPQASSNVVTQDSNEPDYKVMSIKPPYSYASLIALAIKSAAESKMTLSGIYAYIMKNYRYYHQVENGWQNSIRHNLSLNKCFLKVPRAENDPGKGAFWTIDPAYAHLFADGTFRKRSRVPRSKKVVDGSSSPGDGRNRKPLGGGSRSSSPSVMGKGGKATKLGTPEAVIAGQTLHGATGGSGLYQNMPFHNLQQAGNVTYPVPVIYSGGAQYHMASVPSNVVAPSMSSPQQHAQQKASQDNNVTALAAVVQQQQMHELVQQRLRYQIMGHASGETKGNRDSSQSSNPSIPFPRTDTGTPPPMSDKFLDTFRSLAQEGGVSRTPSPSPARCLVDSSHSSPPIKRPRTDAGDADIGTPAVIGGGSGSVSTSPQSAKWHTTSSSPTSLQTSDGKHAFQSVPRCLNISNIDYGNNGSSFPEGPGEQSPISESDAAAANLALSALAAAATNMET